MLSTSQKQSNNNVSIRLSGMGMFQHITVSHEACPPGALHVQQQLSSNASDLLDALEASC